MANEAAIIQQLKDLRDYDNAEKMGESVHILASICHKWDDGDADPIKDIERAKKAVLESTGKNLLER